MSSELIDPSEALASEVTLVDVRSEASRAELGTVAGAIVVGKSDVATEFGVSNRDRAERIVVFCGSVKGSGPVVAELHELGYSNVAHVEGGFSALRDHRSATQGL